MATAISTNAIDTRQSADQRGIPEAISAVQWVQHRAEQLSTGDQDCDWYVALNDFEDLCAELQAENLAWIEQNEDRLIEEHPDWSGKFLAVACRTESKVLAVEDDWTTATRQALLSLELCRVAACEKCPPEVYLTKVLLGDS